MSRAPHPVRFMAIDAGSNATKYRVWEIESQANPTLIAEKRHPLRIGEGVFRTGRISDDTITKAVDVFRAIRSESESYGITAMRAVTTSAAREAQNRDELIDAILRETGIRLEVLSDEDEARLIGMGILAARAQASGSCVMIDIGGGSTEFIIANAGKIDWAKSLPIGAVRMTEVFFSTIPPAVEQIDALEKHVQHVLAQSIPAHIIPPRPELIGSGGTITALNFMAGGNGGVKLTEIDSIVKRLRPMNVDEIGKTFPIDHERGQIILAGALLLANIMKQLGFGEILLVRSGVADGLMREYQMQ